MKSQRSLLSTLVPLGLIGAAAWYLFGNRAAPRARERDWPEELAPFGQEPFGDDPALQGEGNYAAARRHRDSVQRFVRSGRVEEAARSAAPHSAAEADSMRDAEQRGESAARH